MWVNVCNNVLDPAAWQGPCAQETSPDTIATNLGACGQCRS